MHACMGLFLSKPLILLTQHYRQQITSVISLCADAQSHERVDG